ncbi:DUF2989 domain-containing protein [Vibrio sp.]|uniref:DUF2989 domain-containing protein n=1 Tax=Vibrio sp. TaxID=678 RepID=UPI003D0C82ED
MKTIRILSLLSLVVLLNGCFENRKNTNKLCSDNPALRCELLNIDDGQCRVPRTDLIWHRLEVLRNPSDTQVIEEYHLVSDYRKCLELASQIQPIDQTELKQARFNALVHAGDEQQRIVSQLKQSDSPEALYFLWSQIGDDQARRRFLQKEGSRELDTAEMQFALATFYTNRNPEKTIDLLNRALELTGNNEVNTEILKTLASTYYQLNRKELAYIWTQVASRYNVPLVSAREMQLLYGFSEQKYQQLDQVAEDIESAVESGHYQSSQVPNF